MSPPLEKTYRTLTARFEAELSPLHGSLLTPNGNDRAPFHRWFHMKEGFSCHLLRQVLRDTRLGFRRGCLVVDPFVGSGTTVISAGALSRVELPGIMGAVGIERNPFLFMLARAKAEAMVSPPRDFFDLVTNVVRSVKSKPNRKPQFAVPLLSTLNNPLYMDPQTLKTLLSLRAAIEHSDATSSARSVALICLASIVEPTSRLRRDGRALRYQPGKAVVDPLLSFVERAKVIQSDLETVDGPTRAFLEVVEGDGRDPYSALPRGRRKADILLFSPPYPNNIDYTEVYKLEAWILGLFNDQSQFRAARMRTLRSHPSVQFPITTVANELGLQAEFHQLLKPLLKSVPRDRYWKQRTEVIVGYFEDILRTLASARSIVGRQGRVAYVVGNSLHGNTQSSYVVPADVIIAQLATLVGFTVDRFIIGRRPNRRAKSNDLLRESLVYLAPAPQ